MCTCTPGGYIVFLFILPLFSSPLFYSLLLYSTLFSVHTLFYSLLCSYSLLLSSLFLLYSTLFSVPTLFYSLLLSSLFLLYSTPSQLPYTRYKCTLFPMGDILAKIWRFMILTKSTNSFSRYLYNQSAASVFILNLCYFNMISLYLNTSYVFFYIY